jgi:hypothetical protein
MSSPDEVAASDLDEVLIWFPSLAPLVSEYVNTRSMASADIRSIFVKRLRELSGTDWFDAWMCRTAGTSGLIKHKSTVRLLKSLLQDVATRPLTRLEATRALARGGTLDRDDWTRTFLSLSLPLKSELLLTGIASIEEYPWMRASVTDLLDRDVESISRGVLALNPPPDSESPA